MIPFEYVVLMLLFACVSVALIVNYLHRNNQQTAEARYWANQKQPLIFEQSDLTTAEQTIEQHANALSMLKLHGNRWITAKDVHLWVYATDGTIGFEVWQLERAAERMKVLGPFMVKKSEQAEVKSQTAEHAKTVWNIQEENNEN